MSNSRRIVVIGLDCAAPRFIFGPDAFELPVLQSLMARGCWGRLRSCDPPITVPAWSAMMSGKDPGVLGIYGFRNRRDRGYGPMTIADASDVHEPRLWDLLSRHGKQVVVLGVPQTYPVRPVNGCLAAGMLTPDSSVEFTYPKSLKRELLRDVGDYIPDVRDFRTDDKAELLKRVHAFAENRFDTAEYLMRSRPWDFFMMVDMGMDRLHHGFWRYCDPQHPRYVPGNPFERAFRDYYRRVDARIGALVELAGDDTAVLVVSDHGAKAMVGGFCINEWLVDEGYLVLHDMPDAPTRLEDCSVDWSRTRAWSTGGYYARIFLNVAGREPVGTAPVDKAKQIRDEIATKLRGMKGPDGRPMGTRVLAPSDIYEKTNGIPPDLIVYLGDLDWRAIGLVGTGYLYTTENDTGPDDANHDYDGIFVFATPGGGVGIEREGLHLLDVAPTVLGYLGLPIPSGLGGTPIRPGESNVRAALDAAEETPASPRV